MLASCRYLERLNERNLNAVIIVCYLFQLPYNELGQQLLPPSVDNASGRKTLGMCVGTPIHSNCHEMEWQLNAASSTAFLY